MSKNVKYNSSNNIVYLCLYHVVWCTKYRRDVLNDETSEDVKSIALEVAQEHDFDIIEMEVMPDHVHLLISVNPQFGVHKAVKAIKGRSSRELRMKYQHLRSRIPTLWTNSYFVSTTGGAPLKNIKKYIENQKNV